MKSKRIFEYAGNTASTADAIFDKHFAAERQQNINANQLNNLIGNEFNEESDLSKADYDNIIRIVNIFGAAYKKYAYNVIPSGQPNGRISQSVFREYEYIGDSTNEPDWQEEKGPGFGPWAKKSVYEKWQNDIMKILEDPQIRKVLANTKFVSAAESETGTEQGGKKSSGLTLASFIEELLNGKGRFSRIRGKLLKKYLNIGDDEKDSYSSSDSSRDKKEESKNTPYKWVDHEVNDGFKEGHFYRIKYDWDDGQGIGESNGNNGNNSILTFYVVDDSDKKYVMVANRGKEAELNSKALYLVLKDKMTQSLGKNYGDVLLCSMNKFNNRYNIYMVKSSVWCKSAGNVEIEDSKFTNTISPPYGKRNITKIENAKVLVDANDESVEIKKELNEVKWGNERGHNSAKEKMKRLLQ